MEFRERREQFSLVLLAFVVKALDIWATVYYVNTSPLGWNLEANPAVTFTGSPLLYMTVMGLIVLPLTVYFVYEKHEYFAKAIVIFNVAPVIVNLNNIFTDFSIGLYIYPLFLLAISSRFFYLRSDK